MSKNNKEIEESISALNNCNERLNKIAETCCVPERSPNMKSAQSLINELIDRIQQIKSNKDNIHNCIAEIGKLGSQLGFLYATCCTETREPFYQELFKDLMLVHTNMWLLTDHSH